MTTVQRQSYWRTARYHFMRSNYITAAWNWFLMLAGKAAEPFLFASVLYSGYKLLPGVAQPGAGLDAFMFVAQMAALDIGGMALMKLAHQRHMSKKSFTYRVGFVLVGLMIANVVLATLERLIPAITGNIALAIEGGLLVARSIMAVLYGYAVHSLREDEQIETPAVHTSPVIQPVATPAPVLSRHETSVHVHPVASGKRVKPFTCLPVHLIPETPEHPEQAKSVQPVQPVQPVQERKRASNVSMFPVQPGNNKVKAGDRTNIDAQAALILAQQPNTSVRELARQLQIPASTANNVKKRIAG